MLSVQERSNMPINNTKQANKLSTSILNYFAAVTETRFNLKFHRFENFN